jgi:hypothetical protein
MLESGCTLFNPIAESDELGLTLVRLGPRRAFQMIHCGCRDCARYLPLPVNHRKRHDHPVKFVGDKATALAGAEVPQTVNREEMGKLNLTADEEKALVAFLKTLGPSSAPYTWRRWSGRSRCRA